jgi:hypothetical protein
VKKAQPFLAFMLASDVKSPRQFPVTVDRDQRSLGTPEQRFKDPLTIPIRPLRSVYPVGPREDWLFRGQSDEFAEALKLPRSSAPDRPETRELRPVSTLCSLL